MLQNSAEGILVNESPDLKAVMREIDLNQANYFHKGFLINFNLHKRIPIVIYFLFFYQNAITATKQVKPLTLMVSTKSTQLLPDNSLEALMASINCTWKPVKFRWKHFRKYKCQRFSILCLQSSFKIRDYSLIIHKFAYHLFSVFISKGGFFLCNGGKHLMRF